jgi:hypothetical protein
MEKPSGFNPFPIKAKKRGEGKPFGRRFTGEILEGKWTPRRRERGGKFFF